MFKTGEGDSMWIHYASTTIPGRFALVDPTGRLFALSGNLQYLQAIRRTIDRSLTYRIETGHTSPILVGCGLTDSHGELTPAGIAWACHEALPPDTQPN